VIDDLESREGDRVGPDVTGAVDGVDADLPLSRGLSSVQSMPQGGPLWTSPSCTPST